MTDSIGWLQIAFVLGSSVVITMLVFAALGWRDYRRDRAD